MASMRSEHDAIELA